MKPVILLVDDEPTVLDGLRRHLRGGYEVLTATSGEEALGVLDRAAGAVAVIVSDMHMGGMDGVAFLVRAAEVAPDAVRVLLTGASDLSVAAAAINEGRIFRFLSKPCPRERFVATVEAAVRQHRLIRAEREVLAETLAGAIRAVTETVALVSPELFTGSRRQRDLALAVADELSVTEGRWELEVAALMADLGAVAVPPDVLSRWRSGQPLSAPEVAMVARVGETTCSVLAGIPRLDGVRELIEAVHRPPAGDEPVVLRLLRAVRAYTRLAPPLDPDAAVRRLAAEGHDSRVLQALARLEGVPVDGEVRAVRIAELRPQMVLAAPVTTSGGVVLVGEGQPLTRAVIERIRNFADHRGVTEPLWVRVGALVGGGEATGTPGTGTAVR